MATHELPRGIRPRGKSFFVDVTVNGKRKTATCATLAEAMMKKQEMTDALATGKEVASTRSNAAVWTLEQAIDKTLRTHSPEGWKGSSMEKTGGVHMREAKAFFGPARKLDELSRDLIDEWVSACEEKGNSDRTINRKVSALSKVLKLATKHGGLPSMPPLPTMRREHRGRIRQFSDAEEKAITSYFEQTGETWMAELVTVLIDTGMRRGELLNVRPTDVDLKTGVLLIYGTDDHGTKNGEYRSVPMTNRVKRIMAGRMLGTHCFPYGPSKVRHAWDRMRSHLGYDSDKEFVIHTCRHTCASRLVQRGVSIPVVKEWLGHKSIQITMRYSHLMPKDLMNAAKVLEDG